MGTEEAIVAQDMADRRVHERHPLRFEIEARLADGEATSVMTARNLSVGGLYCVSPVGHEPMTRLAVRLLLPARDEVDGGGGPIDADAVVVRCSERDNAPGGEPFEMALLFTGFVGDGADRLERFLTTPVGA